MILTKSELRKKIKTILAEQTESLPLKSLEISKKIIQSDEYKNAGVILAYMALSDEVNLASVIADARNKGKKVYIPKVDPNSTGMEFYEFNKDDIEQGSYGISEPGANGFLLNLESGKELSDINMLILVPVRAFTKQGARLGRGKGYYDKYLARLKNAEIGVVVKAGVCFESQIVQELPVESHDFFMDFVFY